MGGLFPEFTQEDLERAVATLRIVLMGRATHLVTASSPSGSHKLRAAFLTRLHRAEQGVFGFGGKHV